MHAPAHLHDPLAAEREAIVRYCLRFTRDPDVAEDLAQQTLLAVWQHEAELRDPEARRGWILSIARNVCLGWARGRQRERSRILTGENRDQLHASIPDDVDLELELERDELAVLLDRAMALLPAETRDALIHRYIEELPQAEIAVRLGVTEGSVEARLQRGKLALRRVLSTTLSDDARSHGLVTGQEAGSEVTRIWCPGCGSRRLVGRLDSEQGRLVLTCPNCPLPYDNYINSDMGNGLSGAKTFKPALSRVLQVIHEMYRVEPVAGVSACYRCERPIPIRQNEETLSLECEGCRVRDLETWHSISWSLPETRRFWRDHPRMRFLPVREIEAAGSPAVVTSFESVTDRGRLDAVMRRDTLEVLRIERTDTGESEGE